VTHTLLALHVSVAEQQTAAAPTPHFLLGAHVTPHSNLPPATGSQAGFASGQATQLAPQLVGAEFDRQIGIVACESCQHTWDVPGQVYVQAVPLQPTVPPGRGIQGWQLLPQVATSLFDLQVGSGSLAVPPHWWKAADLQTLRHMPVVVHVAVEFLSAAGGGHVAQLAPHWVAL
jgi:hypothetical protein